MEAVVRRHFRFALGEAVVAAEASPAESVAARPRRYESQAA